MHADARSAAQDRKTREKKMCSMVYDLKQGTRFCEKRKKKTYLGIRTRDLHHWMLLCHLDYRRTAVSHKTLRAQPTVRSFAAEIFQGSSARKLELLLKAATVCLFSMELRYHLFFLFQGQIASTFCHFRFFLAASKMFPVLMIQTLCRNLTIRFLMLKWRVTYQP